MADAEPGKESLSVVYREPKELFGSKFEVVGEGDFKKGVDSLIGMGITEGQRPEILYKLDKPPSYQDVYSLIDTFPTDIEIAVMYDTKDWYVGRGFARGRDITRKLLGAVPENGVIVHTHPEDKTTFTTSSIIDTAYAKKKGLKTAVIGGLGITSYTGVNKIKDSPNEDPNNPISLIAYFHDEAFYEALEGVDRLLDAMGRKRKNMAWGEEAKEYWEWILKEAKARKE